MNIKKYLVCGLLGLYIALFWLWMELPDGKVHVRFLDVGQGDAVLITSPFGHNILIDGGPGSEVLSSLGKVLPFFMSDIDLMVLTHPHSDHLNGLIEVFKKYKVKNVLITGVEYENSHYKEFLKDIASVNVYFARSDLDFEIGGIYLDTIYPIDDLVGREIANVNNSSIGFIVSFVGEDGVERRVLLNGDNEQEVENEIIDKVSDVDIFKASHHASKTANTIEFLEVIKPEIVVISCGKDNKFGHPHTEALSNFQQIGAKVFQTDLEGTVAMEW